MEIKECKTKNDWINNKLLASFNDADQQHFCCILKVNKNNENVYHLLSSTKSLLNYTESIFDYVRATSTNLNYITDLFLEKINSAMYKISPPFNVKVASLYVLKNVQDNFLISKLVKKSLGDCFEKGLSWEFEIDFGDGDSNDESELSDW